MPCLHLCMPSMRFWTFYMRSKTQMWAWMTWHVYVDVQLGLRMKLNRRSEVWGSFGLFRSTWTNLALCRKLKDEIGYFAHSVGSCRWNAKGAPDHVPILLCKVVIVKVVSVYFLAARGRSPCLELSQGDVSPSNVLPLYGNICCYWLFFAMFDHSSYLKIYCKHMKKLSYC